MMNDLNKSLLTKMSWKKMIRLMNQRILFLLNQWVRKKIPLFLEFVMTTTKIVILFSGFLVTIISIIAKATWYDTLLRVAITLFVLGLFGVMINYFIGKNFVEAAVVELEEAEAKRK